MSRKPKPSGTKRPSFESQIGRRVERRTSRERLLIVCGAKKTEPDYLQGLKSSVRNPAVSIKILTNPKSPAQVISYTVKLLEGSCGDYDQAWCVLDVDQFPAIAEAVAKAASKGIEIALSNPCFELWLLLHFTDHRRHTPSYDHMVPYLDRHLPGKYSKTGLDFRHYESRWPDALTRAKELAPQGDEPKVNPSTGMWRLAVAVTGST